MIRPILSDALRRELHDCGQSWAMIARGCNLSRSTVCRFAAGRQRLSMASMDRLADYLNVRLLNEYEYRARERVYREWLAGRIVPFDPETWYAVEPDEPEAGAAAL